MRHTRSIERGWKFSLLLTGALLSTACGVAPVDPTARVVQAVYDPATSNLPTPNDLAMKDGLVAILPSEALPAADRELKLGMNGRDGFSLGSSPKVQFTGSLSAASLGAGNVVGVDLGVGGRGAPQPIEVVATYAECDHSISLTTPAGFLPGHQYLFGVRGGPQGVKDAEGNEVFPSSAFYFLRAGNDLREHPDAFPGGTREEKQATADKLEALRQSLEPHFLTLEAQGVPRRELVALWSFTAQTSPELAFDPGGRKLPMPNDLLRDPVSGLVTLPISEADSEQQAHLKRGFNKLDGFSLSGALTLEFTQPIDRDSVRVGADANRTVRLFRADTLEEVLDLSVDVRDDGLQLALLPTMPLRPATPYVALVHGVTSTGARALEPMPLASVLKLENPLVSEDGSSNVMSLCAKTAARLERIRIQVDPVLDQLAEDEALDRSAVSAAFAFTTQDIVKRARALWAAPYEAHLPLEITEVINSNPYQRFAPLGPALPDVARIVTGKMTTVEFLDPETYAWRESGEGVQKQIDFLLTFPEGQDPEVPAPIVVFGHGLYTERRLGLFVANALARRGFAMMAIDFPLHGERTACRPGHANDCKQGSTCASDGRCVLPSGEPSDLARDANSVAGLSSFRQLLEDSDLLEGFEENVGPMTPYATGQRFVDVENLFGARDHFRQALVDLSAQTRLIKYGNWKNMIGFPLDGERIYYAGMSLGGIIGGMAVSLDPNLKGALLNVGGAGLPDLMKDSSVFGVVLRDGLKSKAGIEEGTPEWDAFLNAAKWVLDEADPLNLTRYAIQEPLAYTDPTTGEARESPVKKVRMQMAIGDTVVPNSSTERLAAGLGLNRDTEFRSFVGTHGLICNPSEPNYFPSNADMGDFLRAVDRGEL